MIKARTWRISESLTWIASADVLLLCVFCNNHQETLQRLSSSLRNFDNSCQRIRLTTRRAWSESHAPR